MSLPRATGRSAPRARLAVHLRRRLAAGTEGADGRHWDETVATYRQHGADRFQEVEDNLAALRSSSGGSGTGPTPVKAARESVAIATNQYKAGTANYLAVVVLQTAALNSERTELDILGRRLTSSVGLIKALGGGWSATYARAGGRQVIGWGQRADIFRVKGDSVKCRPEPLVASASWASRAFASDDSRL